MIDKVVDLEAQIAGARRKIASDSYPMSIGELTNLFREGELVIRPAFQRLFRWSVDQKSKLIESILLGIPIPSIFVSQNEDGRWELVDGLQRISTILQLQGLLEADGFPELVLAGTKYLSGLEGKRWDTFDSASSLSDAQRLDFKRSKIDVKIIKRESSPETKYDLFQRLNTYGSPLTPQETRNAMLVGANPGFVEWLQGLAQQDSFVNVTALADADLSGKYDEDLALRFLFLHDKEDVSTAALRRFNDKLDDAAIFMAESFPENAENRALAFTKTFEVLDAAASRDAFRKWNAVKGRFEGGFLNTAFEVIAMGIGYHVARGAGYRSDIEQAAKELWLRPEMTTRFATGKATEQRLNLTLPLGRELMSE